MEDNTYYRKMQQIKTLATNVACLPLSDLYHDAKTVDDSALLDLMIGVRELVVSSWSEAEQAQAAKWMR